MKTIHYGEDRWILHDDGAIERPGLVAPDARTWCVVGAVERNNFGNTVKHYTLEDILTKDIRWQYKNGMQKVHIRDFDHGTLREWRNPQHFVTN